MQNHKMFGHDKNLTSQISFTSFILFHKEVSDNYIKIIDQINIVTVVYKA